MRRFAGIDGGATRTDVLIANEAGLPVARREGAPALIRDRRASEVAELLLGLVRDTLRDADAARVHAACFALTGVGREMERTAVENALRERGVPADWWLVVTDAEAALEDAFGDAAGIVLIAGTGSVAFERRPDGSLARAGGWGPVLGDEGSGWAIGCAALQATARAADGRAPASELAAAVLSATELADARELVHWIDTASRADVAALAPVVLRLADRDPVARAILDDAAGELARLVRALRRDGPGPADVALAGGLLDSGPLRARLLERLDGLTGIHVVDRVVDGARGAVAIARRGAASRPQPVPPATLGE